jgi:hypothetical protein
VCVLFFSFRDRVFQTISQNRPRTVIPWSLPPK